MPKATNIFGMVPVNFIAIIYREDTYNYHLNLHKYILKICTKGDVGGNLG